MSAADTSDTTPDNAASDMASDNVGIDPGRRATLENWLFARLPPWVLDTMSAEQKDALLKATTDASWDRPPVNARLHIPFFSRRYYVTIVGGEDKRSRERRAHERNHYPLRTVANIFFFIGIITLFYLVSLIGMAFTSAIIE
jgi:hypothetical protein